MHNLARRMPEAPPAERVPNRPPAPRVVREAADPTAVRGATRRAERATSHLAGAYETPSTPRESGEFPVHREEGPRAPGPSPEVLAWFDFDRRADDAARAYHEAVRSSEELSARYADAMAQRQAISSEIDALAQERWDLSGRTDQASAQRVAAVDRRLKDLSNQRRFNQASIEIAMEKIRQNDLALDRIEHEKADLERRVDRARQDRMERMEREAPAGRPDQDEARLAAETQNVLAEYNVVLSQIEAAETASKAAADAMLRAMAESQRQQANLAKLQSMAPGTMRRFFSRLKGTFDEERAKFQEQVRDQEGLVSQADDAAREAVAATAKHNETIDRLFQQKDALDQRFQRIAAQLEEVRARRSAMDAAA